MELSGAVTQPGADLSPPDSPESPPSGAVRRHHTITATSRAARANARTIAEEAAQPWNDDEVVDDDWVGGVGAVGEKNAALHRQASLPTKYNRAFQRAQARQAGSVTPRTLNSLEAITAEHAHEEQEEEWEAQMRNLRNEEDDAPGSVPHHQQVIDAQSQGSAGSPLSPHFNVAHIPSPPPADSNIRRHQSLTYGAKAAGIRRNTGAAGLKRAGTLSAHAERGGASNATPSPPANEADLAEEEYYEQEERRYPLNNPTSPVGRSSPWAAQQGETEWRVPIGMGGAGTMAAGQQGANALDDVQRALTMLELNSGTGSATSLLAQNSAFAMQPHVSGPSPRFGQPQGSILRNNGNNGSGADSLGRTSGKLQLMTEVENGARGKGPVSAAAAVPGIGQSQQQQLQQSILQRTTLRDDRGVTSANAGPWGQKDRVLGSRSSNPNLQYTAGNYGELPPNPQIPAQYMNQQGAQPPRLGMVSPFGQNGQMPMSNVIGGGVQQQQANFLGSPIDIPSLIASKGYNPANFDIHPVNARFFVIKSFTEDDVHKSLKYEIWSSTDPGNKRLDKAFKENANKGPIYLFFSVNASGHFCGVAEMLTPVDYTRSSTVWASDKWKGVFKVRWIFVRDIPNANLRHIRLNNTQERKPVTNSRDTQELLPEAGEEMLRIFVTHPARTSLLQDYAFYELQAQQKQAQAAASQTSPLQTPAALQQSPQLTPQQHPYAMPNPFSTLQMSPMLQMQMGGQFSPPMGNMSGMSNVMRGTSPQPMISNQGYGRANGNF